MNTSDKDYIKMRIKKARIQTRSIAGRIRALYTHSKP
jgi:hypothetical protein